MIDPEIGKDSVDKMKFTYNGEPITVGPKVSFTLLPVGDINIIDGTYSNGAKHIYKPQEDITPYELALLLNLFVFASTISNHSGIPSYDYWGYVKEKGLERHFT